MNILKELLTFDVLITVITGALFIFFMELYGKHNKLMYLIWALSFTIVYLFYIYKMSHNKINTVVVNLSAKVFPMIVLTILGIFILNNKYDIYTFLGLALIFVGAILVAA
jgi:uncharacterized membrane protein